MAAVTHVRLLELPLINSHAAPLPPPVAAPAAAPLPPLVAAAAQNSSNLFRLVFGTIGTIGMSAGPIVNITKPFPEYFTVAAVLSVVGAYVITVKEPETPCTLCEVARLGGGLGSIVGSYYATSAAASVGLGLGILVAVAGATVSALFLAPQGCLTLYKWARGI